MLKLFARLEDPKRPLLGPNIKLLQFWGLLLPKNVFKRNFYLLAHSLLTIFIFTMYIDIWFVKDDLKLLLYNLKITMLAVVSLCKAMTFLFWQKDWWSVINYVTKADMADRETDDPKKLKIINKYTKYSRKISLFYVTLMYATVVVVICQPFIKYFSSASYRENVKNGTEPYLQVVSSWVPFDKNTIPGYLAATCFQSFAAVYGGGWITSYDCNAFVLMVFIKAELELLRIDCSEIFGTKKLPVSDEVAVKRLKKCHRRHVELIKYVGVLDSCLSPNMLLYMFVCSVMFCVTAFQITTETSKMQQFMTAEYLVFGIAQLFIYCWHSTDVFYASTKLALGLHHSCWWNRNVDHKKNLYILTAQFNKVVVFTAGPFTTLTMATCNTILKGAYSYYTLLRNSQM